MKRFLGFARLSSRKEEVGLDSQEQILHDYAARNDGTIVEMIRAVETATETVEKKSFQEMLAYGTKNAGQLDGVLFYSVDRAARNLEDLAELETLLEKAGIPAIYVTQVQ